MNTKYTELAVQTAIGVLGLLVVFLATKTITEIVSWSKDTTYPTKTIMVSADGEATAVADIASFTFAVEEEGATSEEAKNKSAEKINKALEYLKENKVDEKDIKNENYSLYPKYNNQPPCFTYNCPVTESKIIGYTVSQSIRVKVREADKAGTFLSELTKFGINNISGITFTIDDEEVLYEQARKDAVTKAKAKAEVLAKDLDVRLGKVISFNEDSSGGYPRDLGMGGAETNASFKSAVPEIPRGENKYTSRVYVTYELK